MARFTRFQAFQKVGGLVNERVLVSDRKARHPPPVHIRLIAVSDKDGTPAANEGVVTVIKVFQPVQVVKIPTDRSMLAVDLEGVQRFVASGGTRDRKSG